LLLFIESSLASSSSTDEAVEACRVVLLEDIFGTGRILGLMKL
jgi:hypothetical protein